MSRSVPQALLVRPGGASREALPDRRGVRTSGTIAASIVVPIRHSAVDEKLVVHLRELAHVVDEVIVADGSDCHVADAYARMLGPDIRHLEVDPDVSDFPNGKVGGVVTGVRAARHACVVVADDDVRHTRETVAAVVRRLDAADVVIPQNYFDAAFDRLPWHARWDTARTLVRRGTVGDWPGTLGVRRAALLGAGGYSGDCLFENLELVRTIRANGGKIERADDVLVARRPPSSAHFGKQRVRQAYDSFAEPAVLVLELSIFPLVVFRWRLGAVVLAAALVLAERGRRHHRLSTVVDPWSLAWVPFWVTERAVCSWAAVALRVGGGVPYNGRRLRIAAHRTATLRRCRAVSGRPAAARRRPGIRSDPVER